MSDAVAGDLSDAVLDCAVPVVVTRFLSTPLVNGRVVGTPKSTTFGVMVSVQPMTQKELLLLPEGERAQGRVKGYTVDRLLTIQTSECQRADRFKYKNVDYEIDKVDDWSDLGSYFRIEAVRLDR